ncbi:ogr/Delta-like zinc finger family protein [Klebsiella pneumoniae]|uniref:ogr/Delta-like zinc finger family protein n=1 Tax=Klebsiella pneumoniae TaxID=573 RepID=UPI003968D516
MLGAPVGDTLTAARNPAAENVKESYLQCQNVYCSTTFKTHESIFEIIRSPAEEKKAEPAPPKTRTTRKVKGCYSSPFSHNQERR